jgi:hypothetical protein
MSVCNLKENEKDRGELTDVSTSLTCVALPGACRAIVAPLVVVICDDWGGCVDVRGGLRSASFLFLTHSPTVKKHLISFNNQKNKNTLAFALVVSNKETAKVEGTTNCGCGTKKSQVDNPKSTMHVTC